MKSNALDNTGTVGGGQSLQAVGLWLKEVREQKGESLENVAKITRIGKNYLEAIEEGDAAKLPSQAYTRGFIRLYATHLGVSPDEALLMINGQGAEVSQLSPPEVSPAGSPQLKQRSTGSGRTKKLLFSLLCVVAITVIVVILVNSNNQKSSSPGSQAVPPLATPAVTAPATSAPPAIPPGLDTQPAAPALQKNAGEVVPEEGIVLRLKAVSSGRLHITIDGSVSQEYDLVAGDLVEWKAEKMFLLDLENASSVEGELDGKPLKPFGEAGKTAHLIIRQDGVQRD